MDDGEDDDVMTEGGAASSSKAGAAAAGKGAGSSSSAAAAGAGAGADADNDEGTDGLECLVCTDVPNDVHGAALTPCG